MTEQQITKLYEAMVEIWGEDLPNVDQEPRRFEYFVKLFRYCHADEWNECLQT